MTMPRTPKNEGAEVDLEAEAFAIREAEEQTRAEEAVAAFIAAEKSEDGAEEGAGEAGEVDAEPVLGEPAGEEPGEPDAAPAEAEADTGSVGEESPGSAEEVSEAPAPERPLNSAELRPTTQGGLTILTQ